MNEKNETDKLQRLIDRCDKCDLAECINCEISWTEVQALKGLLDKYNNLKEIEEEHRKENGMLHNIINQDQQDLNIYKELLRQEKEKNGK